MGGQQRAQEVVQKKKSVSSLVSSPANIWTRRMTGIRRTDRTGSSAYCDFLKTQTTVGEIINFLNQELRSYFENQNSYFVVTQPRRAVTQKCILRPAEHTAEVSSSQFLFTSPATNLLHQPAKVSEMESEEGKMRGGRSRPTSYRQEFWSCFFAFVIWCNWASALKGHMK